MTYSSLSLSPRLSAVMCMGVTAGAYILTLFAVSSLFVYHARDFYFIYLFSNSSWKFLSCTDFTCWWQMKHRHRVHGLILISPVCTAPCWTEWLYNKVSFLNYYDHLLVYWNLLLNKLFHMQVMSNLLYFYGMCGVVKELLLKRYFSKVGLNSLGFDSRIYIVMLVFP